MPLDDSVFYTRFPGTSYGSAGGVTTINVTWPTSTSSSCISTSNVFSMPYTTTTCSNIDPGFHRRQIEAVRKDYMDVQRDPSRKRAEEKARRLFVQVAGEIAFWRFKIHRYHEIRGASGTVYRLQPGRRVLVLGADGQVDHELCGHLPFGIPWWDTMVVQHLMLTGSLETEEQFKKLANKNRPGAPYVIPELGVAA